MPDRGHQIVSHRPSQEGRGLKRVRSGSGSNPRHRPSQEGRGLKLTFAMEGQMSFISPLARGARIETSKFRLNFQSYWIAPRKRGAD